MTNVVKMSIAIACMIQIAPAVTNAGTFTPNTDSARHYMALGSDETAGRRYAVAWKYYENASKFDANNADAQKGIADVCLKMNRMAPAIVALEKYVSMRPTDNEALVKLTNLYFNYGNWAKVIEYAPKMHQRVPSDNSWNYMMGKAYYSNQNYGKALSYLQEALKANENNADANYLVAHTYTLMSNYTAGLPYYRKSLAQDSVTSNGQRLYEFALVLSTAGQADESINIFMEALNKGYKARDDFYMNMAYTLADAHQTERAVKMLEDILERRPTDIGVLEALADVSYHNGNYNRAIKYWDKMLAIDENNARALYQIGLSYIKLGKQSDGQTLCDKAIAMDPALASLRRQKSSMFQ